MFKDFINKYSVPKTLKFELIPIGNTSENIKKYKIIETDRELEKGYEKVKLLIDEYHRSFISRVLNNIEFGESLLKYEEFYSHNTDLKREKFEIHKKEMRKKISKAFKDAGAAELFKNTLITKLLPGLYEGKDEVLNVLNLFKKFTTYFKNFHENRKNIYSSEEKSTAISYRIINENLPIFIHNIKTYERICSLIDFDTALEDSFLNQIKKELNCQFFSEFFNIHTFNRVLSQEGINSYNLLLGGKSEEDGTKIKGVNELLNLFCQETKEKLPKFKFLKKQILSDMDSKSFVLDAFNSDSDVLEAISSYHEYLMENIEGSEITLKEFIGQMKNENLDTIYIKDKQSLKSISQKVFGSWSTITEAIYSFEYDEKNGGKGSTNSVKYNEKKKNEFNKYYEQMAKSNTKLKKIYSLSYINKCIKYFGKSEDICDYFIGMGQYGVKEEVPGENLIEAITSNYSAIKFNFIDKILSENELLIEKVKRYLDSIKELQMFLKPLNKEGDKNPLFYGEFDRFYGALESVTPLYNMVRNYVTKKPYSKDKLKLNFSNAQLLNGWDKDKESDYLSLLFKKGSKYYLGVLNNKIPKVGKCFDCQFEVDSEDYYEKMEYKQLSNVVANIPRIAFSDSNKSLFSPSNEILKIQERGSYLKSSIDFDIKDLHQMIDFFKNGLKKKYSEYDFNFSNTSSYSNISDFYQEVIKATYKVKFRKVPSKFIDDLVDVGKLFLFQLHNKDYSIKSKGKKNLHTIYWESLFSEANLKNPVHKLNGEAEIFFRKSSIQRHITHPKGQLIESKREKGKFNKFSYDLIKDKRYTEDKFFLHVPITLNRSANDKGTNFNTEVCNVLSKFPEPHIIGVDRGERHLIYLSVIDSRGKIIHQESLNTITNSYIDGSGKEQVTEINYHSKLDKSEEERSQSRKNWKKIENIKELKQGYLSHVVHRITSLMFKYNGIVILEDLNFGFKRGRFHVEKQVYQKFEKALIDKLNLIVSKNVNENELGGIRKPYQLTSKFTSFKELGKQTGFLFYVNPNYTSKLDPTTGFSNQLLIKYESINKTKEFLEKFDEIKFNKEENYFEFHVDFSKFTQKKVGKTKWVICTKGDRISNFNRKQVYLTNELKELFNKYEIDYKNDIQEQFRQLELSKAFYESFLGYLRLTLQMRNNDPNKKDENGNEIDYIISPVKNDNNRFFDSRDVKNEHGLPVNGDANGAYNIALKGLMLLNEIKEATKEGRRPNLAIKNEDWFKFVQNKEYNG